MTFCRTRINYLDFFALSSVLCFLNLGFDNEIYPYWLFTLFIMPINRIWFNKLMRAYLLLFFLVIIRIFFFGMSHILIIDTLQATSVFFAVHFYVSLNVEERNRVLGVFEKFVYIQFVVLLLQYASPSFLSLSSSLFNGRGTEAIFAGLARNSAVVGFSPEPSYGSSLLVGIFFLMLLHNKKMSFKLTLVFIGSILLFKSVLGFGLFVGIIFIHLIHRRSFKILVISLILGVVSFLIALKTSNSVDRLYSFAVYLAENRSLFKAEQYVSPGSTRLDSFLAVFNWNYYEYFKSISVLVYLGQIAPFLLLLFSMFLAFYRVKKVSNFIFRCFVIISAFFMTPMLLWPSLAGVWVLLSPKRR
jgi:hypothetical protein